MPYTNTTLATLQARLSERYDGQPFWSADQSRRAINEGMRIWNLVTGMWRGAFAASTIPNDVYLFVSGTLVKGTRVTVGGVRLVPSSVEAFDLTLPSWEGKSITSGGDVPSYVAYWAPVGLTTIAIYPADVAPLGSPIVVDGVRNTPILVAAGDFLDMGDEEINTLLGYALHVLSFSKGSEALQKTLPLKKAFFQAAAKRNDTFRASSLYRKVMGLDRARFQTPMQLAPNPAEVQLVQATENRG